MLNSFLLEFYYLFTLIEVLNFHEMIFFHNVFSLKTLQTFSTNVHFCQ